MPAYFSAYLKIALQQSCKRLAVSRLVTSHFIECSTAFRIRKRTVTQGFSNTVAAQVFQKERKKLANVCLPNTMEGNKNGKKQ
jgi:hypothetical protein